jgi:hypothetical protein
MADGALGFRQTVYRLGDSNAENILERKAQSKCAFKPSAQ